MDQELSGCFQIHQKLVTQSPLRQIERQSVFCLVLRLPHAAFLTLQ